LQRFLWLHSKPRGDINNAFAGGYQHLAVKMAAINEGVSA
jgi:hypothetical protein